MNAQAQNPQAQNPQDPQADRRSGPGQRGAQADPDAVRFWRLMSEGIAAGSNVGGALAKACELFGGTAMGQAIAAVHADVMQHQQPLSQAMRAHPEAFDPRAVAVVEAGEYGGILDRVLPLIVEALEAGDPDRLASAGMPSREACQYVSDVLQKAQEARASDLHFEPLPGSSSRVRIRVDGVLRVIDPPPADLYRQVVTLLKLWGAMEPSQRRLPQDGRCNMRRGVRLDISVIPVHEGEQIVVRILRRAAGEVLLGLDRLGLSDADLPKVRRLAGLPWGLVVVTAPAGHGKTTILYSMLHEANTPEAKILTVEDPVEVSFAGMGQMQIAPQAGLTFARAIRAIIRQDPDVIMVGEIRDLETANLCAQVALTGHLLLTTLHADTAAAAVRRLVEMGLEPFRVSASMGGVIAVRLVRRLCPHCRKPAKPAEAVLPPAAREWLAGHPEATFYTGSGCDKCDGIGYRGRAGVFEVMMMSERLRQMVSEGAGVGALRDAAVAEGMTTMLIDGLEKAAAGVTSITELLAALPIAADR